MTRLGLIIFLVFGAFTNYAVNANAGGFKITSEKIKSGGKIEMEQVFDGFGCTGKNISPDLKWTGAPKETKSFAVTMFDPDAPTGSGFWHWVVFNIPPTVTEIRAGASGKTMPAGSLESRTDFGKPGYGGPCPPPGNKPHHYIITVYALKDMIKADIDSSGALVGFNIHANQLAAAKMTATFGR